MRQIKIRGHKRIHRQIENWRVKNLQIDKKLLANRNEDWVKILVHPFCDISILNSTIPHPKRKTKTLILSALFDIYDNWKMQLDQTGQPFYLKIWLYENQFSKSQIVCAVGDALNFYDNIFYKSQTQVPIRSSVYGQLKNKIENYSWELYHDENYYTNDEVGDLEMYESIDDFNDFKKWFNKLLKKNHRTEQLSEKKGNAYECYFFYRGKIWVGGKN